MWANEFAKVGVQIANFRSRPRELPALCFERRMLRREFPFFQAHETRSRPVQRFIERCRHQRAVSFHNFGTRPVRTAPEPKAPDTKFQVRPQCKYQSQSLRSDLRRRSRSPCCSRPQHLAKHSGSQETGQKPQSLKRRIVISASHNRKHGATTNTNSSLT